MAFRKNLNKGAFSTLKTQLKKAGDTTIAGKKRGRPAASVNGTASRAPVVAKAKAAVNPADLVRGLRPLIAAYGAAAVKDMADALAE